MKQKIANKLYHVTTKESADHILNEGLFPQIGDNSRKQEKRIQLFSFVIDFRGRKRNSPKESSEGCNPGIFVIILYD